MRRHCARYASCLMRFPAADGYLMKNAGLIEMLFSFGVVIALILWDLYNTPRPPKGDSGDGQHAKTSGNDSASDTSD